MAFMGFLTFVKASNTILLITGALSLPLYFSYFGTEAAVRFSLLLCVHSAILAAIPDVVKAAIPMLQLLSFAVLLFLPFNTAPTIVVWCYLKLLQCSEFALLFVEAIQVVLVVMYISQSFVNEIEDQPVIVKTSILAISGVAYILSIYLSYHLFTDIHSTHTETWCAGVAVILTILVLFICLYKEEGIISDAAVVSLVMIFIVWVMKQERLMQENSLDVPLQWLQQVADNRSFLKVFLSMAKVSIAHATRVKRIFSMFISPTCLLLALMRIASVVGFVTLTPTFFYQKEDDEYSTLQEVDLQPHRKGLRPLYLRLIIIFVYTQVVVRTIASTTTDRQYLSQVTSFTDMLPGNRVWRIMQLLLVTTTYIYQMFKDEYQ
ncbi:uncharacterized protein LOC113675192 [Pocillopora damicornis]|uniref:uncharacterized protein LOC113675192 n=1 Tax=Pocillopora damicornis TaxID=46731 RepID=UPI000F556CD9|nr:uncharacterized protein LOC113675192 [Pocillopora damicornis]